MASLHRHTRASRAAAESLAALVLLCGCGLSSKPSSGAATAGSSADVIEVVAAEDFWGSIAAQVGGTHVHVTSIVTDPNADPHSYEPTPADARTIAGASMVVANGVGYDPWVAKLVGADSGTRTVLDVGSRLGLTDRDNPHRWYNPTDVETVIATMVNDYSRIDPADARYFHTQAARYDGGSLAPLHHLVTQIKATYGGTPVGASESIFSMLAPALGLHLVTPYAFLKAISEGTDVSAGDKATIDHQIAAHLIRIYVYNSQNTTPDVSAQLAQCREAGIPTTTITETLVPPSGTYQAWQTRQLQGILDALQTGARP